MKTLNSPGNEVGSKPLVFTARCGSAVKAAEQSVGTKVYRAKQRRKSELSKSFHSSSLYYRIKRAEGKVKHLNLIWRGDGGRDIDRQLAGGPGRRASGCTLASCEEEMLLDCTQWPGKPL